MVACSRRTCRASRGSRRPVSRLHGFTRTLGGPGRTLRTRLEDHVVDPHGLAVPAARPPQREALAHAVVAEVAHGEEVVVRDHADGRHGATAVVLEEGQDLAMMPVVAD